MNMNGLSYRNLDDSTDLVFQLLRVEKVKPQTLASQRKYGFTKSYKSSASPHCSNFQILRNSVASQCSKHPTHHKRIDYVHRRDKKMSFQFLPHPVPPTLHLAVLVLLSLFSSSSSSSSCRNSSISSSTSKSLGYVFLAKKP